VVQRQTIAGLLKKMFDLSIKSAEKKLWSIIRVSRILNAVNFSLLNVIFK
jgi:hypothetical protein